MWWKILLFHYNYDLIKNSSNKAENPHADMTIQSISWNRSKNIPGDDQFKPRNRKAILPGRTVIISYRIEAILLLYIYNLACDETFKDKRRSM